MDSACGNNAELVACEEIDPDDILIDRDIDYLEYVDGGVEHRAVAIQEGTTITDAVDIALNFPLLYIEGNDVE
jgi:hypothetical protein